MTTPLAARTWVALVHHPVLDSSGRVVTTALTNLDVHDIARSARTFGVAGYLVVTPIEAQRELVSRIIGHWTTGEGREHNVKRSEALARVVVVADLEEARRAVEARHGAAPFVVATGARPREQVIRESELVAHPALGAERPLLLVFGTGWGLAEGVFEASHAVLGAIRGGDHYNHLSVRSAVAIVLDRLFGNRESQGRP